MTKAKTPPSDPDQKQHRRNIVVALISGTFIIVGGILTGIFTGIFTNWDKFYPPQQKEQINPEITTPSPAGTQVVSNSGNVTNTNQVTISANLQKTPPKVTPTPIGSPKENPAKKKQSMAKARSLAMNGEYEAVTVECDRILATNPNNAEAKRLKSWAQNRLGIH